MHIENTMGILKITQKSSCLAFFQKSEAICLIFVTYIQNHYNITNFLALNKCNPVLCSTFKVKKKIILMEQWVSCQLHSFQYSICLNKFTCLKKLKKLVLKMCVDSSTYMKITIGIWNSKYLVYISYLCANIRQFCTQKLWWKSVIGYI